MEKKQKNKFAPTYEIFSSYRGELMGFAILTIILFHFLRTCKTSGIKMEGLFWYFMHYIGSGGVDIFLFLSGLGLYYSFRKQNGKPDLAKFYMRKIIRILVPYLLIAIPALVYRDLIRNGKGVLDFLKDLTFLNFIYTGERWYWYIGMILVCYLLFPYIYQMAETAENAVEENLRVILMFTFCTLISYLLWRFEKDSFDHFNVALLRFFPFIMGTFTGKKAYEKRPITSLHYAGLFVWLVFHDMRTTQTPVVLRTILFMNCLVVCFCMCLFFYLVRELKWHPIRAVLRFIGKYTLELYLTHVTVRAVMGWHGYKTDTILRFLVMLAISILLSALIHALSGWITGRMKR